MAVIDAWMQHPTLEFLRHEMFQPLFRWLGTEPPNEEPSVESTIEQMDAAGVERSLISAWYGANGPILRNDDVAAAVAAHPDRLVGVGSVDLSHPVEAARQVRHCVDELGFRAIRVIPWLWGLPPNDRRYYPVYVACVEAGVPFCLQVGHTGPLRPSESGRPIPYLDDVALEFPELTIVGGHIGYPWTDEMISLATKYPNVYIDTSAYTTKRYPPELVRYMRGHGCRKVLFGSNYPMLTPAQCLADLDSLDLAEETTRLFLHDNAARVFGLD